MTLLMQEEEEPQWMNSLEAQSWANRYSIEFTADARPISACTFLVSRERMGIIAFDYDFLETCLIHS